MCFIAFIRRYIHQLCVQHPTCPLISYAFKHPTYQPSHSSSVMSSSTPHATLITRYQLCVQTPHMPPLISYAFKHPTCHSLSVVRSNTAHVPLSVVRSNTAHATLISCAFKHRTCTPYHPSLVKRSNTPNASLITPQQNFDMT